MSTITTNDGQHSSLPVSLVNLEGFSKSLEGRQSAINDYINIPVVDKHSDRLVGFCFRRIQTSPNDAFSKRTRDHLEWSWNFGVAEQLLEDARPRALGKEIAPGITRGEDATDEDLVLDFLRLRIADARIPSS